MNINICTSIWHDGMMGLVVGDALGVPVEFMTRSQISNSKEGPVTGMRGYGTYDMPPGTWSDDSSMALATIESMLPERKLKPEWTMILFSFWQDNGDYTPFHNTFDEGNTCRRAINNFKKDKDIKTCGVRGEHANGNGALMRILPVCLFVYEKVREGAMSDEEAIARVHEFASLTHNHLRSNMCCGTYYFLIKSILDNREKEVPIIDILQQGMDSSKVFYKKNPDNENEMKYLDRIWELYSFKDTAEEEIRSSGYVIDTIEAALWCLINTGSYRDAVLKAVNLGDDTDTVGAVCGGLAGLYYGFKSIPEEWVMGISALEKILDPCDRIAGEMFRYGYSSEPYQEELLSRLKKRHRWVTHELMNSIARLEIEEIDGRYEFVKYYTYMGEKQKSVITRDSTAVTLGILEENIANELVARNPVIDQYIPKHSPVEDKGGWRLERYEIRKHETGDFSLFQQSGDRNTGGYREDMINPSAFEETDYSEFLEWIPHCGIAHEELLSDEGLREFFEFDKKRKI